MLPVPSSTWYPPVPKTPTEVTTLPVTRTVWLRNREGSALILAIVTGAQAAVKSTAASAVSSARFFIGPRTKDVRSYPIRFHLVATPPAFTMKTGVTMKKCR
jgi:hypothetical protein